MKKTFYKLCILIIALFIFNVSVNASSCKDYNTKSSCEHNLDFSCIWNDNEFGTYCNTDKLIYVSCGDSFDIPYQAPRIVSFAVNLFKIATPLVLIFISIISLLKALAASKEDEIKKAQSSLIKKFIYAALVFFVVSIVQFVILKVADSNDSKNITSCLDCFLNNNCETTAYYKTAVGSVNVCTRFKSGEFYCKDNK